jgi:hypothetical protein
LEEFFRYLVILGLLKRVYLSLDLVHVHARAHVESRDQKKKGVLCGRRPHLDFWYHKGLVSQDQFTFLAHKTVQDL